MYITRFKSYINVTSTDDLSLLNTYCMVWFSVHINNKTGAVRRGVYECMPIVCIAFDKKSYTSGISSDVVWLSLYYECTRICVCCITVSVWCIFQKVILENENRRHGGRWPMRIVCWWIMRRCWSDCDCDCVLYGYETRLLMECCSETLNPAANLASFTLIRF